ncbi:3-hydroxyacyl-CoA dehydrogenase [Rhodococcus pyridinivorans KG-16]|uniref:3-hydroxyacyl-CoA dehydrogenase n=1 Tax=Rhodococcus pyridinivorans KG-16 TaxID=1441730 RepID=A0A0V9UPQ7_9NOCA|nr:3-hydroxyacyl-CoA dehydrogenase [Rhodococcus pyridinivorans]KSZ59997.1 3-hydroxyacyl-CoA dehydrogenase [Rhodococcus pyridinivorans KG-16]
MNSRSETAKGATIGVVGAGMMGAAIAYTCALAGAEVVLVARTWEGACRGRQYAERREARALDSGATDAASSRALLDRIEITERLSDLGLCALVVEAVAENVAVKQQVLQAIEAVTEPGTVLASTTSTLPITTLASKLTRPEEFVGMHFFSPVDRMRLVETIVGTHTSETTLSSALHYARLLGKTPIVVRDSRGFFTSRVMERYLDEALIAVGAGIDPDVVEHAAKQAGYPVPPLQLFDEISLTLNRSVQREQRAAVESAGGTWEGHEADRVRDHMIDDHGRGGRAVGRGFYDYDGDGTRLGLWSGLREAFGPATDIPVDDMRDRLLFAQVVEACRCLDEGVVTSEADADTGSVLGIGFPVHTGGVASFRHSYPGGARGFAERADELADRYGDRFRLPATNTVLLDRSEHS